MTGYVLTHNIIRPIPDSLRRIHDYAVGLYKRGKEQFKDIENEEDIDLSMVLDQATKGC